MLRSRSHCAPPPNLPRTRGRRRLPPRLRGGVGWGGRRHSAIRSKHHRIDPRQPLPMPEDPRRDRPLARQAAAVEEDGDELVVVDGDGQGLAQFSRSLGQPAHHRVQHVEAHVVEAGPGGGGKQDAPVAHVRRQVRLAVGVHADGLVETVGTHPGGVVIALQEFVPVGHVLLLQGVDHRIHHGQALARVRQQARLLVARITLGRIEILAVMGVAFQAHDPVGIILGQVIGAGAHRLPVQAEVLLRHARLAVEAFRLLRHRREEGHGQPVDELGVLALDADPVGMAVHRVGALEIEFRDIEIGVPGPFPGRLAQGLGQILEADDVIRHQAQDGGLNPGMGQAANLVDVILGGQLPATRLGETLEIVDARQFLRIDGHIARLALLVPGEAGMGLVTGSRLEADFILGNRDPPGLGIGGKRPPRRVEIAHRGHGGGGLGLQLIGPLQVVILQRRLVDVAQVDVLVLAVGTGRVEMLGAFLEGGIEDGFAGVGSGIGAVDRLGTG
jgi:hypothetical protein